MRIAGLFLVTSFVTNMKSGWSIDSCTDWPDSVTINEDANFSLGVLLAVRRPNEGLFGCGSVDPGVLRTFEALRWRLEQINKNPDLSPAGKLGLKVIDTCGYKGAALRSLLELHPELSESECVLKQSLNTTPTRIWGVIDQSGVIKVESKVMSLLTRHHMKLLDLNLDSAIGPDVKARAVASIVSKMSWSSMAVLNVDDELNSAAAREFHKSALFNGFCIRNEEVVPPSPSALRTRTDLYLKAIRTVTQLPTDGLEELQGIIIFATGDDLRGLLSAIVGLANELRRGIHWLFVGMPPNGYRSDTMKIVERGGHVSFVTPASDSPPSDFEAHWSHLWVSPSTVDDLPWLRRRLATLLSRSRDVHSHEQYRPEADAEVGLSLELLDSWSRALKRSWTDKCSGQVGPCAALRQMSQQEFGKYLRLEISENGTSTIPHSNRYMKNLRFVTADVAASDNGGQLLFNQSLVVPITKDLLLEQKIPEGKIMEDWCQKNKEEESGSIFVKSNKGIYLSAVLPIRKQSSSFFSCGSADADESFLMAAGMAHALITSNSDSMLRTGTTLGLVAVDDCHNPLRGITRLFQLLSGDLLLKRNMTNDEFNMIASITVEDSVTASANSMLQRLGIAHLTAPTWQPWAGSVTSTTRGASLDIIEPNTAWFKAAIDALEVAEANFVSVLHSDDENGHTAAERFVRAAADSGKVCVVETRILPTDTNRIRAVANDLVRGNNAPVVVVLAEDKKAVHGLLDAVARYPQGSQLIFLTGDDVLPDGIWRNPEVNVLSIGSRWSVLDEFKAYLSNLSLQNHGPIPTDWFREFWERYFQCNSLTRRRQKSQFSVQCTGKERIDPEKFFAIPPSNLLRRLHLAVRTVSVGLQNYLTRHCPEWDILQDVTLCGSDWQTRLQEEIRKALVGDPALGQHPLLANSVDGQLELTYSLLFPSLLDNKSKIGKIGTWKDDVVTKTGNDLFFNSSWSKRFKCSGVCLEVCSRQVPSLPGLGVEAELPVGARFKSTWGAVTAALSVLGMLLVVACTGYFIVVVPNSRGTILLGYVILAGVLLLYGVNFAFVALPTIATCAVRRIVMGLAYAIVFSAKLVKVVNIWRLQKTSTCPAGGGTSASSVTSSTCLTSASASITVTHNQDDTRPAFLVLVAVSLAMLQLVLAIAWLILSPPSIAQVAGILCCAPGEGFEEDLIVSLTYVLLLVILTVVFSVITCRCEDNYKEARWILLSSTFTALLWVAWTILATQMQVGGRDPPIVVANLLSATVVLLCLFLPKVYLYSKFLQQARRLDIKSIYPQAFGNRTTVSTTNLYSPFKNGSVLSGTASTNGYSTRSPLPAPSYVSSLKKTSPGDRPKKQATIASSPPQVLGSEMQVMGSDLYPLHMYDGGSQFQPGGSHGNLSSNSFRSTGSLPVISNGHIRQKSLEYF